MVRTVQFLASVPSCECRSAGRHVRVMCRSLPRAVCPFKTYNIYYQSLSSVLLIVTQLYRSMYNLVLSDFVMPVFKVRLGGKASKVTVLANGVEQLKLNALSKFLINDSASYVVIISCL